MLVYRIEDDEGRGPWTSDTSACDVYNAHHQQKDPSYYSCGMNPGPMDIQEQGTDLYANFLNGSYIMGCKSLEQLESWFPQARARKAMVDVGMSLHVYEVPRNKVLFGRYQLAFLPEDASLVKHLDLETLEEIQAAA